MKSEFLIVAATLLRDEKRPMTARELVDLGQERDLFSDNIAGETPYQTMKSKLSVHIVKYGESSVFIRTEPGKFYLRALLEGNSSTYWAKPSKPPKSIEKVLVYKASELDKYMTWQGVKTAWRRVGKAIFEELEPHYIERYEVEQNNEYTQVLTYILVTRGKSILAYQRGTYNRVEKYLKGADCIGFGGHVVQNDINLFSHDTMGVYECAIRELNEELALPEEDRKRLSKKEGLKVLGVINDDSTDVGRRHIAFILEYKVSDASEWDEPKRGEKGITRLRWISSESSSRVWLWTFEYWSQLCFREFAPKLVKMQPAFRLLRSTPLKPPHLLLVIGPVGSGKSQAKCILKDEYDYKEINSGEVLAGMMGVPPIPLTDRRAFQAIALEYITRSDGPKRLAKEIVKKVRGIKYPRILVDGVRQKETVERIKGMMGREKVGIVYVQTPFDQAYEFYSIRIERGASVEEYLSVRNAVVESEVESMISFADAVLYNWTGKLKYKEAIDELMLALGTCMEEKR